MIPELEESRSVKEASTPQRMASVTGHPKNRLYIDSGESLHVLFNKELMGGLVNLDRPLKIQAGGKQFICHKLDPYIKHYDTYLFQ